MTTTTQEKSINMTRMEALESEFKTLQERLAAKRIDGADENECIRIQTDITVALNNIKGWKQNPTDEQITTLNALERSLDDRCTVLRKAHDNSRSTFTNQVSNEKESGLKKVVSQTLDTIKNKLHVKN